MAINKPDWETKSTDDVRDEAQGIFKKPILEEESLAIQELYSKLRESFDKTNEHITDVANMKSDISTNTAKTGISSSQAKAITNNTSKVGINQVLQSLVKNLSISGMTFTLMQGKSGYSLRLETSLSNKEKHYVDLPLTKGK